MQTQTYKSKEPNQAKIFLLGYRSLLRQQEALADALDEYRERAMRSTGRVTATRIGGTNYCSPLESNGVKAVDAERALQKTIDNIGERLQDILDAIQGLGDERQKEILTMRYVAGYSWETVCVKTSYEASWAYELHGRALTEISRFQKERSKTE